MYSRVVAYSLWGNNETYLKGFIENLKGVAQYYPGWEVHVYLTKDVQELLKPLLVDGGSYPPSRAILMDPPKTYWEASLWRFRSLLLSGGVVIFRDADSRISEREQKAVQEWLDSDKQFHIMRDHPYHTVPIMAGMWGAKLPVRSDIASVTERTLSDPSIWDVNTKGADQVFLQYEIYNRIVTDAMIHVNDCSFRESFAKDFPTARLENKSFVGEAYDEHNNPPQHDRDLL